MQGRVIVLALLTPGACAPAQTIEIPTEEPAPQGYLLYSRAADQEELFFKVVPFQPDTYPPQVFETAQNERVYLKALTFAVDELPDLTPGVPNLVQIAEADFPRGPVLPGTTYELNASGFQEVQPSVATQPAFPVFSEHQCVANGGCPTGTLIRGTAASGVQWTCKPGCEPPPEVAAPILPLTDCERFGWRLNSDAVDFVHCEPRLPDNPMVICDAGQMMAFDDPNCRNLFYPLAPAAVASRWPGPLYFVAPGATGVGTQADPAGIGARPPQSNETWVLLPGHYTELNIIAVDNFTLLGTHDGVEGVTLVPQGSLRLNGDNILLENLRVQRSTGPTTSQRLVSLEGGTVTASVVEVLGRLASTAELHLVNSSIKANDVEAVFVYGDATQVVIEDSELVGSGGVWSASKASINLRSVRITTPQSGRLAARFTDHGDINFDRVLIAGDFKVGVTVVERDEGQTITLNQVIVDLGSERLADTGSRGISFADSATTAQTTETISLRNIGVKGAFIGLDLDRGEYRPMQNLLLKDNIKGIVVHPKNSEILQLQIDGLWIDMQSRRANQRDGFGIDIATDDETQVDLTDVVIRDNSTGAPLNQSNSNATITNGNGDAHLTLTRARIHSGWRKGITGFLNHKFTDVIFDRCDGIPLSGPLTRERLVEFELRRIQLIDSSVIYLEQNVEVTDLTISGSSDNDAFSTLPQVCLRNDTRGFLRSFAFDRPSGRGGVIGFQAQRHPVPIGGFEIANGALELASEAQLVGGGQCLSSTERLSDRAEMSFTDVNVTLVESE